MPPSPRGAKLKRSEIWLGWCGIVVPLVISASELNRDKMTRTLRRAADARSVPVLIGRKHTGRIGDYVLWMFFDLT